MALYNPRNPVKQSSQSQSTLLEVRVICTSNGDSESVECVFGYKQGDIQ